MNKKCLLPLLVVGGLLAAQALARQVLAPPVAEAFPGKGAYQTSLAQAEAQYVASVTEARKAYVEEIQSFQMRARMTQEMHQRLEAEKARVSNLLDPVVIPEPKAAQ